MELKKFNTLALNCQASQFFEVADSGELARALSQLALADTIPMVLGEGSNVVFQSSQIEACLKIKSKGIRLVTEDSRSVVLEVQAGENWNSLVNSTLAAGYFGLENLALIPGTVGAAPVQNIGAYGVELSEFIEQVSFRDLNSAERHTYTGERCHFAYRDSVFKQQLRDKTVIETVRLSLRKKALVNRNYDALAKATAHLSNPSPLDIRDAVVKLRSAKLPDPNILANAGSFFKNPIVDVEQLQHLLAKHNDLVFYPTDNTAHYKLAAAWLIDRAGWKGRYDGPFGMHDQQALVLINVGGEHGKELLKFADRVSSSVFEKFGVRLHIEPRIY